MKATAKKEVSDFERAQKRTGEAMHRYLLVILMHEFETLKNPLDNDFIETNILEKDMTTIEDYNLMNDTDETYCI